MIHWPWFTSWKNIDKHRAPIGASVGAPNKFELILNYRNKVAKLELLYFCKLKHVLQKDFYSCVHSKPQHSLSLMRTYSKREHTRYRFSRQRVAIANATCFGQDTKEICQHPRNSRPQMHQLLRMSGSH